MGFFKEAFEVSPSATIARLHGWIWSLIYGGLLLLVLGIVTRRYDETLGWTLVVIGAVLAAIGFVLIWVRSRLSQDG